MKKASVNEEYSGHLFSGCENLVGGTGTKYDSNHVDISYAHVDGGTANSGYLTYKQGSGIHSVWQNASSDSKWHTLGGASITKPLRSGLYIHNRQKVIVR